MLITKDGAKEDGHVNFTLIKDGCAVSVVDVAKKKGVSVQHIHYAIQQFIVKACSFDDIFDKDFTKKARHFMIGGEKINVKYIVEKLGCSEANAYRRMAEYGASDKTNHDKHRLMKWLKGKDGVKAVVAKHIKGQPSMVSGRERALIDAIPSGGSWEEKHLKPTKFSGGGYSGDLDCRVNLPGC